jgi:hypothetical protein
MIEVSGYGGYYLRWEKCGYRIEKYDKKVLDIYSI